MLPPSLDNVNPKFLRSDLEDFAKSRLLLMDVHLHYRMNFHAATLVGDFSGLIDLAFIKSVAVRQSSLCNQLRCDQML